ncbi:hypothetical protein [Dactylosporangium sp. CA-092794]|uniref:hypothetical protein n=1 Tax=Dactylosporangium sp. CA-092794 TaxID=3239929 RepID=UPI003D8CA458
MDALITSVPGELLEREPAAALRLLAGEVRALHHRMHPADVLFIEVADGELAIGRHEVPALAMLFEHHDVDAATREEAVARAAALLASARLRRG